LQKIFRALHVEELNGRIVPVESLAFLLLYLLWVVFGSDALPQRHVIGNLAVFIPYAAVALELFVLRDSARSPLRWTWTFLALALILLATARVLFFYIGLGSQLPGKLGFWFDLLRLGAFPFFFLALFAFPFENRYAPSRFRFLLDSTIASGATIALGFLVFPVQPGISGWRLVPLLLPILDLVLCVLVLNIFLANQYFRDISASFGFSFVAILISDYLYYISTLTDGYHSGKLQDLGWIVGTLLLGLIAVATSKREISENRPRKESRRSLNIQNILPVAMVLVLFWYVLARWQFSGEISLFGLIMSLLLVLLLIVRVGIRAGEGELLIYWQLFKNVATPVFLCDRKGRIVLVNPVALRELDIADEKAMIGRRLDTVFPVEDQLRTMLLKPEQMSVFVDKRIHNRRVPFSLMFSPVYSENGKLLLAVTAYNLTEQKHNQDILTRKNEELLELSSRLEALNTQLEEMVDDRTRTLKRAMNRLEEQNKLLRDLDTMKSEFVSLVSHELRTPLTSLKGGLELILRNRNLPKKVEKPLTLMIGEVERLAKFVINILDVSSVEAGKIAINIKPINPVPVIQSVLAEVSAQTDSARFRMDIGKGIQKVRADEMVLHSVLLHLVDNAIKYAPEGDITLAVQQTPGRTRFQVLDHGPGIPEDKRHLLFRRFQRINTSDAQSVYGYGLGLYFSRKMLAAMKGRLTYVKLHDGRSCFQFSLQSAYEEETITR